MPPRWLAPGIILLVIATILSVLASISLPFLTGIDVVRVHATGSASSGTASVKEVRFGVWAYCFEGTDGSQDCSGAHHGYTTTLHSTSAKDFVIIGSSWTRGLAVHPVAAVVTFFALLLSFSAHTTVTLMSSLMSFLAALLTLIAFAIDIALYVYVKHQVGKLEGVHATTNTAPAFWFTFISFFLLCFAGCTVCFYRRRDRMSGATSTYPMSQRRGFFSRFRRN